MQHNSYNIIGYMITDLAQVNKQEASHIYYIRQEFNILYKNIFIQIAHTYSSTSVWTHISTVTFFWNF